MNDYKSTLNLPKTKFPMRGNLAKKEPEILANWINDDLYSIIRFTKRGKKKFILHDGPPYANGNIHIGHSINKILKDIIIKYKSLAGFDSPYIPGWDCHGLPIELKVEQKYGKPGKEFTDAEFRAKCREYAIDQINSQRKDFIRLGILGDWKDPYLTMDFKTEANIIRTLSKIIKNGHLYRGAKPVHWCINCHSALAEAEIEYFNKMSTSIYVVFEAANQNSIKRKFGLSYINNPISILIWTTTLWTLPSNNAISLSSKFEYALVKTKNRVLIIAKDLAKSVMKRIQINEYTILGVFKGSELELMKFKHPFLDYEIPIVLSNHVTLDIGTGAVHIAGGYGYDDYNISLKYGLEIINSIDHNGTYATYTHPKLDRISIFKANNIIISLLNKNNALIHIENIEHNYPHCWRHKSPTIFRITPQWFISMDQNGLRKQSLEKIKKVRWIPILGRLRIKSMITSCPDWCISRQRTWGVPMSLFIHKKTGKLHPRILELMERVAKLVEINGIQAWWDLNPYDLIGKDADLYEKVSDTLDVWFDSGSTYATVMKVRPEFTDHTIDMYLEGSDQYRGWFMSSLMISTAIKNEAPYRQVLTHGFAVDSKKRKMSKSLNNTISPQSIINKLGADVLRLWVASTNYAGEITISNEILKRIVDSYRRIRNTARFLLANINDFDPIKNIVKPEEMILIDRWAVGCAKTVQEDILKYYESYDFHKVVKRIMRFCSVEMGSFYLDIIKDRQYTAKIDSIARRSCQTALYHIIEAFVRWLTPIMSFTASEIWDYLPGNREKYIFAEEWYKNLFSLDETGLMNNIFWDKLLEVRNEVNKIIEEARFEKKINTSLEVSVTLYAKPELAAKLNALGDELRFILLTSNAKVISYTQASIDAKQSKLLKDLKIALNKAKGKKCSRCWHFSTDVGKMTKSYEDLCGRCISNIIGNGEERKFV